MMKSAIAHLITSLGNQELLLKIVRLNQVCIILHAQLTQLIPRTAGVDR